MSKEEEAPTEAVEDVSSQKGGEDDKDDSSREQEKDPIEYNPRWVGYVSIMFISLLNFTAISTVPSEDRQEYWIMSMVFGIASFLLSLFILIHDRAQMCLSYFHYTKARDGYLEGYVLISFVIWWLIGVAYITQPGGVAYVANNIYYSSWASLFSCAYTLNEWSAEKDIITIEEITSISMTLRSWYIHFISACVVFSSSIQLHGLLYRFDEIEDTSFGIAIGFVSMVVSLFFILVHYDFFKRCHIEESGWSELFSSVFLVIAWIVGVSILTKDGGIAATVEGNHCYRDPTSVEGDNCTIVLYLTDTSGANSRFELACERLPRQVRSYGFLWISR